MKKGALHLLGGSINEFDNKIRVIFSCVHLTQYSPYAKFPTDIAPFLTVWGAEINVELALILEVEIW